jgi:hypothetical protein
LPTLTSPLPCCSEAVCRFGWSAVAAAVTVTAAGAEAARFPDASIATARTWYSPGARAVRSTRVW